MIKNGDFINCMNKISKFFPHVSHYKSPRTKLRIYGVQSLKKKTQKRNSTNKSLNKNNA